MSSNFFDFFAFFLILFFFLVYDYVGGGYMTLNEKIGYQTRTERLIRRLTLETVSNKMGMSASTILRYETGKFPIPVEKLQEYCEWFVFGGLKAIPETSIQNAKTKYVKLSGCKNIRIHDFRHSCASLLINSGANISLVSKYLGHSNIAMTLNIYTHFYKSDMEELIDTLNKMKYE